MKHDDISTNTLLILCILTLLGGLLLGAFAAKKQSSPTPETEESTSNESIYKNIQPGLK